LTGISSDETGPRRVAPGDDTGRNIIGGDIVGEGMVPREIVSGDLLAEDIVAGGSIEPIGNKIGLTLVRKKTGKGVG
jgi:hypothetical protein